jgi:hypothetical protein
MATVGGWVCTRAHNATINVAVPCRQAKFVPNYILCTCATTVIPLHLHPPPSILLRLNPRPVYAWETPSQWLLGHLPITLTAFSLRPSICPPLSSALLPPSFSPLILLYSSSRPESLTLFPTFTRALHACGDNGGLASPRMPLAVALSSSGPKQMYPPPSTEGASARRGVALTLFHFFPPFPPPCTAAIIHRSDLDSRRDVIGPGFPRCPRRAHCNSKRGSAPFIWSAFVSFALLWSRTTPLHSSLPFLSISIVVYLFLVRLQCLSSQSTPHFLPLPFLIHYPLIFLAIRPRTDCDDSGSHGGDAENSEIPGAHSYLTASRIWDWWEPWHNHTAGSSI